MVVVDAEAQRANHRPYCVYGGGEARGYDVDSRGKMKQEKRCFFVNLQIPTDQTGTGEGGHYAA